MAVNPPSLSPPWPVPGFQIGIASCGVKSSAIKGIRPDLALIVSEVDCHAAGVFTQNRMRAACVDLGEKAIAEAGNRIRCIVANSGNANAGLGRMEAVQAKRMIACAAKAARCQASQVLSASTGVVGQPFPIDRIEEGIESAANHLRSDGWALAAEAIRTTDTFAKWSSFRSDTFTITGIAKGSGMIHPNMATMLAFIATDAALPQEALQRLLTQAVDRSFNCISVDGDTSTNDTVYLLASGLGLGHKPMTEEGRFAEALNRICIDLAQMIVRDGEGVSKFVTIRVTGASSREEARLVGRTVAVSPLVKTAFAGSDANWGRILVAVGNAPCTVRKEKLSLYADEVCILKHGELHPDYSEEKGMRVFAKDEFCIRIDLGCGSYAAEVWTGDLTHEYIRINAEYRT